MSHFGNTAGGTLSSKGVSTGFAGLRENIGSTLSRSLPRHQNGASCYWEALSDNQKKLVLAGACSVGLVCVGLSVRKLVNCCWSKKSTTKVPTPEKPPTLRSDLLREAIDIAQEVVRHERQQLERSAQQPDEQIKGSSKLYVSAEKPAEKPRTAPVEKKTAASVSSASVGTGPFGDVPFQSQQKETDGKPTVPALEPEKNTVGKQLETVQEHDISKEETVLVLEDQKEVRQQIYVEQDDNGRKPKVSIDKQQQQEDIDGHRQDLHGTSPPCEVFSPLPDRNEAKNTHRGVGAGEGPTVSLLKRKRTPSAGDQPAKRLKEGPLMERLLLPKGSKLDATRSMQDLLEIPTAKSDVGCCVYDRLEEHCEKVGAHLSFPSIKSARKCYRRAKMISQRRAAASKDPKAKPQQRLASATDTAQLKYSFDEFKIEPVQVTSVPHEDCSDAEYQLRRSNSSLNIPAQKAIDPDDNVGLTDLSCLAGAEISRDMSDARRTCEIDDEALKQRLASMLSQSNHLLEKDYMCPTETYTCSDVLTARLESEFLDLATAGDMLNDQKHGEMVLLAEPCATDEIQSVDFSLNHELDDADIPDLEEELLALDAELSDVNLELPEHLVFRPSGEGANFGDFQLKATPPLAVCAAYGFDAHPPVFFDRGDYCDPVPILGGGSFEAYDRIEKLPHSGNPLDSNEEVAGVPQKSLLVGEASAISDGIVPDEDHNLATAKSALPSFSSPVIPPRRSKSLPLLKSGSSVLSGFFRLAEKAISAENLTEESRWRIPSLDLKQLGASSLNELASLKGVGDQLTFQLAFCPEEELIHSNVPLNLAGDEMEERNTAGLNLIHEHKNIGAIHVIDPDLEDLYFDAASISNTPKLSSLSMFQSRQAIRILTDKVRKLETALGTEKCTRKVTDEVEDLKVALDTLRVAFASAGFPVDPNMVCPFDARKSISKYRSPLSTPLHSSPRKRRRSADDDAARDSSCMSNTLIDVENLLHQSVVHEFRCHELKYLPRDHRLDFQRRKNPHRIRLRHLSDDGSNTTNDTMLSTSYLCSDTIDPRVEEAKAFEPPVVEDLLGQQPEPEKLKPSQVSPFHTSDTLLDAPPLDYDSDHKRALGLLKLYQEGHDEDIKWVKQAQAPNEGKSFSSSSTELPAIAASSAAMLPDVTTCTQLDYVNTSFAAANDSSLHPENTQQLGTEEDVPNDPKPQLEPCSPELSGEVSVVQGDNVISDGVSDIPGTRTAGGLIMDASLGVGDMQVTAVPMADKLFEELHDDVTATVMGDHIEANTEGFNVQDPAVALAVPEVEFKTQDLGAKPLEESGPPEAAEEVTKQNVPGKKRKPAPEVTTTPAQAEDSGEQKPIVDSPIRRGPSKPRATPSPKQAGDEVPEQKAKVDVKPRKGKPAGIAAKSPPGTTAKPKAKEASRPPVPRQANAAAHVSQSGVVAQSDVSHVSLMSTAKPPGAVRPQAKRKPEVAAATKQGGAINRKPPGKTTPAPQPTPAKHSPAPPKKAAPAKKPGPGAPTKGRANK